MIWNEIITAIVTSLIASVVFWVVFNVIPSKVERKKIKPLLDFDLYQIYTKLAHFLEMPLKHSNHSPSHLQMKLYHGQLKKEDFEQYLSAKCLTEEYLQVDSMANNLMPIGKALKGLSGEIVERVQKLYVFNRYLSAREILLCRKITDKITMYDFERKAFQKVGNLVLGPVDPTMRNDSAMFYDTYLLFLELQGILIAHNTKGNELGDIYRSLNFRKMGLLYGQGKFNKVIRIAKKGNDNFSKAYYFRSLIKIGDREKGLAALRMHLQEDSTRLIYQRGYFEEFIDDNEIKETLFAARSEEEYEEMAICIKDEREQQRLYEEFVRQMHDFYVAKLNTHVRSSVKKQ